MYQLNISVSLSAVKVRLKDQSMSVSAANKMPLHLQVSDMLAREIQTGILIDGEKLAPERQMASHLSISVGTLRKALLELQEKGMLQRIHGSGNYVSHNPDAEKLYTLFRLELINDNGEPTAKLLSIDDMVKPNDLPEFGESNRAFRFRRLRMIGDVSAAIEEIWLDGSYATSITTESVPDSMYLFYKEQLGFWITRAVDRVSVAPPPDWAPNDWTSSQVTHCGFVERQSRDQNGRVAEYSRTWFDPTKVQFVSRR